MDWKLIVDELKEDVQKKYIFQKIKLDPLHYSLKDRVILYDNSFDMHNRYDQPSFLNGISDMILKLESKGMSVNTEYLAPYTEYVSSYYASIISDINTDIVYRNNLVMDIPNLYKNNLTASMGGCSDKVFKSIHPSIRDSAIPAYIGLIVRLKREGNLIRYLKNITVPYLNIGILSEKITLEDCVNVSYMYQAASKTIHIVLLPDIAGHLTLCSEDIGCSPAGEASSTLQQITKNSMLSVSAMFPEILREWDSMPDSDEKDVIEDMLLEDMRDTDFRKIYYGTDKYGKLEFTPEMQDIITTYDNSQRLIKITKMYNNHKTEALDIDLGAFPNRLGIILRFCDDLATADMRVKQALSLIDVCKKLGLDNDFMHNEDVLGSGDFTSSDAPSSEDGDAESDDSIFHKFTEYTEDKEASGGGKHKPKKESFEALDKLSGDGTSDGYSYDVRDAFSINSEAMKRYYAIASKVNLVNKELTKKIKDIKTYNEGGRNPGLPHGRLDRKNVHRYKTTSNIFYNNTYKIKESDLAIGILLDVSGSMYGRGIYNGKTTLIVLHETLKALSINHCIATHTSSGQNNCIIRVYQHFKEHPKYSARKNYAIADITARSGNCDSGALHYMEAGLMRARNKDKICLIFSDGEPTNCTDTQLKEQVYQMESEGIKVIGIGIDFPNIMSYYKDNANGKNLKQMLDIVSGILKKYILEKE